VSITCQIPTYPLNTCQLRVKYPLSLPSPPLRSSQVHSELLPGLSSLLDDTSLFDAFTLDLIANKVAEVRAQYPLAHEPEEEGTGATETEAGTAGPEEPSSAWTFDNFGGTRLVYI